MEEWDGPLLTERAWRAFDASSAGQDQVLDALGLAGKMKHFEYGFPQEFTNIAHAAKMKLAPAMVEREFMELKAAPRLRSSRRINEKRDVHPRRNLTLKHIARLLKADCRLHQEGDLEGCERIKNVRNKGTPWVDAAFMNSGKAFALAEARMVFEYKRFCRTKGGREPARPDGVFARAVGQIVCAYLVNDGAFSRLEHGHIFWGAVADDHYWNFVAIMRANDSGSPCKVFISEPVPVVAFTSNNAADLERFRTLAGWCKLCVDAKITSDLVRYPVTLTPAHIHASGATDASGYYDSDDSGMNVSGLSDSDDSDMSDSDDSGMGDSDAGGMGDSDAGGMSDSDDGDSSDSDDGDSSDSDDGDSSGPYNNGDYFFQLEIAVEQSSDGRKVLG